MARIMKTAAVLSAVCTALFCLIYRRTQNLLFFSLGITAGTIAYHIIMRLVIGFCYNSILHNKVNYKHSWFRQRNFEPALYEKLRVKSWKAKMPTFDRAQFDTRQHSWEEIGQTMCQSELVHETIVAFSFLPLAASVWFGSFPVFLITSLCSAAFDMLFVIMQRYNRPIVLRLAERQRHRTQNNID